MALPQITVTIDPPLVSDTPEQFNAKAFAAWQTLAQLTPQVNAWSIQVDAAGVITLQAKTDAQAAATSATASKDAAAASATTASNAATSATASKDAAAASATTASNAATSATASKDAAAASATTASSAATSATSSKDAAAASATTASNAATSATSSKDAAAASATTASNAATSANASKDAAAASATTASNAATSATASKDAAAASATAAANSASAASNSKDAAAASATAAANSAASIAGGPVASVNGATGVVILKTVGGQNLVGAGDIPVSSDIAVEVRAAGVKSTLADADELPVVDSEDSWSLKRLDFSQLLANIAAKFTDVFAPKSHVGTGGTAHSVASDTSAGFMSSTDKLKLDYLDETKDVDKPVSTAQQTAINSSTASNIAAAASKNVPVDADELGILDSANGFALKKTTVANLKSIFGSSTINSVNGGQVAGFRNKIINGKMEIAQRGTSFSTTSGGSLYAVDRWVCVNLSAGALSITKQVDAPLNSGIKNSLRAAVTTADTSVAAGDVVNIAQFIEGYNVSDLVGRTFTLSFDVRSSKVGTHCVAFVNSNGDRSYVAEYTILTANTWEQKTIQVVGGIPSTGTWDFANGAGLRVSFNLGAGATYHGVKDTWNTTAAYATSNQVNCLDTVGNIFAVTGVQLEVGSVATPFEHRPYGMELALCQRYYYRLGQNRRTSMGWANTTNSAIVVEKFPVTMRQPPSSIEQSGVTSNYSVVAQNSLYPCNVVPTFQSSSIDNALISIGTSTTLTVGQAAHIAIGNDGYIGFSAEL